MKDSTAVHSLSWMLKTGISEADVNWLRDIANAAPDEQMRSRERIEAIWTRAIEAMQSSPSKIEILKQAIQDRDAEELSKSKISGTSTGLAPEVRDMPSSDVDLVLKKLKARADAAVDRIQRKAVEVNPQMYLPGFDIGAMPNHLNRSSLIAPIARGKRKFHHNEELVTRNDCVLKYTGEQMDEADGELIMALIFFAKDRPFGAPVPLNRATLLKKIGRDTGKAQYEWLMRRMKALTIATLDVEVKKKDGTTKYKIGGTSVFHILSSFDYDEESKTYTYSLDPRWVTMFSNSEYALIDWEKRMQIARGQDMAKTLQRLIATSADTVQRYALDWLKEKMLYTGRMNDFRDAIERSIDELKRLGIILHGVIELSTRGKEQLTMWIPETV